MRALFSIISLLVVLAVIGMLAKKQSEPAASLDSGATQGARPQQPSEQVQKQVKQSVEGALQQARPMPDDATP